jgi:hypothetical protein
MHRLFNGEPEKLKGGVILTDDPAPTGSATEIRQDF